MKFRPTQPATLATDLHALADFIHRTSREVDLGDMRDELTLWLNAKLDDLCAADLFGTEGQSDPRGDHRD